MLLQPRFLIFSVVATSLVLAPSAAASCVPMTAAQRHVRAQIIFNGVALDGPTATGIERFRVIRYLKGKGPKIVRLTAGRKRYTGGGGVTTSVSIDAKRARRGASTRGGCGPGSFRQRFVTGLAACADDR